MKPFPKVRAKNVIERDLGDELLVYDEDRHQAHCLNRTAGFIWKQCDGKTSVKQITRRLQQELSETADERFVWYAISQFNREHLLEEKVDIPEAVRQKVNRRFTRRQAIRVLGVSTIVAVPLVTSIVAPTAAHAATCIASGNACTSGPQCCSGICNNGACV